PRLLDQVLRTLPALLAAAGHPPGTRGEAAQRPTDAAGEELGGEDELPLVEGPVLGGGERLQPDQGRGAGARQLREGEGGGLEPDVVVDAAVDLMLRVGLRRDVEAPRHVEE